MIHVAKSLTAHVRRHGRHVSLVMAAVLGVAAAVASCSPRKVRSSGVTFLAYAVPSTGELRARWSDDGVAWRDGGFPALVTSSDGPPWRRGIGAAANTAGSVYNVVSNVNANRLRFTFGLGPAAWSSDHKEGVAGHSAPAIVYLGNDYWLVFFELDRELEARVYDGEGTLITSFPINAPAGVRRRSAEGAPAAIAREGKVVVAWRWPGVATRVTSAPLPPDDVDSPAEMESYWGDASIWSLDIAVSGPEPGAHQWRPSSGPGLAHDGETFYLIYVRQQRDEDAEPIDAWTPFVYSSPDAVDWNLHSILPLDVGDDSFVDIAALPGGRLVAAAVRNGPNDLLVARSHISAARYQGGTWGRLSDPDVIAMFGDNFALPARFALLDVPRP